MFLLGAVDSHDHQNACFIGHFLSFSTVHYHMKISTFWPRQTTPIETIDDITSQKTGVMSRRTSGKLITETLIFAHFPHVTVTDNTSLTNRQKETEK